MPIYGKRILDFKESELLHSLFDTYWSMILILQEEKSYLYGKCILYHHNVYIIHSIVQQYTVTIYMMCVYNLFFHILTVPDLKSCCPACGPLSKHKPLFFCWNALKPRASAPSQGLQTDIGLHRESILYSLVVSMCIYVNRHWTALDTGISWHLGHCDWWMLGLPLLSLHLPLPWPLEVPVL